MGNAVTTHAFALPVVALSLLMIYAGASKAAYVGEFRNSLLFVPHLPIAWIPAIAFAFPVLEVLGGVGLLRGDVWGGILTALLLLSTALVALLAVRNNQRVPCACFASSGSAYLSRWTVLHNLILIVIALMPAFLPANRLGVLDYLNGAAIFLLYLSLDALGRNMREMNEFRRIQ